MKHQELKSSVEIGALVRDLRKAHAITQAQLAGLANTGVRFVSDLENGKESCQIGKVLNVLSALGMRTYIFSPHENK